MTVSSSRVSSRSVLMFLLCSLASVTPGCWSPAWGQATKPLVKGAVLVVDTDDTCHFFIDDEDEGGVSPEKPQRFKVGIGEHILKCRIDQIPNLVWRKVVEVKDTSQVAAVVSLLALHLQYQQAAAKATDAQEAASENAKRQLDEAEAEQRQREAAAAEIPEKMFELVKGLWQRVDRTVPMFPAYYSFSFDGLEDGSIVAHYTFNNNTVYKYLFTPVPPNRLIGLSIQCVSTRNKKLMKPGSTKDSRGWADCAGPPSGLSDDTIVINGNSLIYHDFNIDETFTR